VLERAGETGPITRVCRYINQRALAFVPDLKPLFDRHRRRTVRESLSLLYVAMTRAKSGLYMLVDAPKQNNSGADSKAALRTLAGVVQCGLAGVGQKDGVLFALGDIEWHAKIKRRESRTAEADENCVSIKLAPSSPSATLRGWASRAASQLDDQRPLRTLLRLTDSNARLRGLAIHALFQQVEWLEDFEPDEQTLLALVRSIAPRQSGEWITAQVRDFRTMLKADAVRHALTRGSRERTALGVNRELPFARLVDGRVQRGSIDRIVIDRIGGRIRSASIIDFKTDQVSASDAPLAASSYRSQLQTYRQAVAEMMAIDEKTSSIGVLFVEPGMLINL